MTAKQGSRKPIFLTLYHCFGNFCQSFDRHLFTVD